MSNELKGQGGSYVVDPETQTLVLVERTKSALEVEQEAQAKQKEQAEQAAQVQDKKAKGK